MKTSNTQLKEHIIWVLPIVLALLAIMKPSNTQLKGVGRGKQ